MFECHTLSMYMLEQLQAYNLQFGKKQVAFIVQKLIWTIMNRYVISYNLLSVPES